MGLEIERKFLVINDAWREQVEKSTAYHQGYIVGAKKASVRVRIQGNEANLNIKGATLTVSRAEFEYPIPLDEAKELLDTLCDKPQIEKTRHLVTQGEHCWEIDEFHGDNQGLIVAEIELKDENEPFEKPLWLGEEVSEDERYYNVKLTKYPYKDW